jgi:hypothetical protein
MDVMSGRKNPFDAAEWLSESLSDVGSGHKWNGIYIRHDSPRPWWKKLAFST